jgi:Leucine-rich repeat (LRR) protein
MHLRLNCSSHFLLSEQLSIWGMSMSGTIPPSLYNLSNLKGLHLRNNDPGFEGPIRSEIGHLLQLEELILHDNPLITGTLPSELGLCQNLSES